MDDAFRDEELPRLKLSLWMLLFAVFREGAVYLGTLSPGVAPSLQAWPL